MLASEFPLSPLVVFLLVGKLSLVLQPDELGPRLLDVVELAELQLLHRFVVPEQHGMFQILLDLTFVQLLMKRIGNDIFVKEHFGKKSCSTETQMESVLPPLVLNPAQCCGERSGSSV